MRRLRVPGTIAGILLIFFVAGAVLFNRTKPAPRAGAQLALDPSRIINSPAASTVGAPSNTNVPPRKEEELNPSLWNPAEKQIHGRIAQELRSAHPRIATLLTSDALELQFDEVFATLIQILDESKLAPAAHRPPLLLAADRLADQLRFSAVAAPTPETKHHLDQLAEYGLSFEWSQLGAAWVYTHELLWKVWRDYSASPWADDAFIQLLARNWDTSFDCRNGSDSFRTVIRQGEDFVAGHAQSQYRLETVYFLAQANETWWSLSRARACTTPGESDCDEYVDPSKYRLGAEEARQKATDYYQQVLRMTASTDIVVDARGHLGNIQQKVDTVQRRFYCIYD